jgi:hypothetical protein
MVSGDVKDNLTFMARGQLGWTAGSYFIQGSVALSEGSKGSVRNVGDLVDFRQGMSAAFNQAQRSASAFWGPLKSLHDLIEQLQRNWVSIYVGGGASGICNNGSFSWFRDRGDFGRYFPPIIVLTRLHTKIWWRSDEPTEPQPCPGEESGFRNNKLLVMPRKPIK